ncbi:hypothetical protein Tco_0950856 [Tanacetum coccineum]
MAYSDQFNTAYGSSNTVVHDKEFNKGTIDALQGPRTRKEKSEEEVAETMAETMEQYMSKTQADYGSGIARPKIDD